VAEESQKGVEGGRLASGLDSCNSIRAKKGFFSKEFGSFESSLIIPIIIEDKVRDVYVPKSHSALDLVAKGNLISMLMTGIPKGIADGSPD
jgi:hypothetical protein